MNRFTTLTNRNIKNYRFFKCHPVNGGHISSPTQTVNSYLDKQKCTFLPYGNYCGFHGTRCTGNFRICSYENWNKTCSNSWAILLHRILLFQAARNTLLLQIWQTILAGSLIKVNRLFITRFGAAYCVFSHRTKLAFVWRRTAIVIGTAGNQFFTIS